MQHRDHVVHNSADRDLPARATPVREICCCRAFMAPEFRPRQPGGKILVRAKTRSASRALSWTLAMVTVMKER